ncbi:MAG: polysaccharide biosynthesis tyrosine autokinase [Armatimonadota bacterium]|nr:polysaccharide biosynthesis tyrosine autokinase [Armatimonadota bacterium]
MAQQKLDRLNGSVQSSLYPATIPDEQLYAEPEALDLQALLGILFRRWWIVLMVIAAVFAFGMIRTFAQRPIYESTAKIVVVTNASGGSSAGGDLPLINDLQALTRSRSIETQAEVISNGTIADEAFRNLSPRLRVKGFGGDSLPGWAYRVSTKKDTEIITVTGRAYDPKAAAQLANGIAETYFKRDLERNNQATKQVRKYAGEQMATLKKDLAAANTELSQFKRRTGLIAPEAQLEKVATHIAQLRLDGDAAKAELAGARRQVNAFEDQLHAQQEKVIKDSTITRNPQFAVALARIDDLHSQRAALLQEYTPRSREVQKLNGQIKAEEASLKRAAEMIVSSRTEARNPIRDDILKKYSDGVATKAALSARIQTISSALSSRQKEFDALPEEERQLTEHMQKVEMLHSTHHMLSQKYYNLLLSERSMLPNGQLVAQAQPAGGPAFPNHKKSAILYFVLGVMMAAGVVTIIERLDVRLHDPSMMEQLSGAPTLTLVPIIPQGEARLISDVDQHSPLLESFRILRNNISFSAIDREIKLLAVTSAGRGEGKSTTSANLAMAMAMDGKRTLLVDCDLRRPSQHKVFQIPRDVGFTTVVTGQHKLEEAVLPTRVPNLQVLASGPIPPNPAEVLNSQRSRDLFRQFADQYDVVIVDCPPCAGLSDVQVIATLVDGVVLVASVGETLRPHLHLTVRTLARVDTPIIGGVINKINTRGQGYYNYYYYSYHYTEDGETQTHRTHRHRRKSLSAARK